MAELFKKDSDTISLHIRNIYKEGELIEKATPGEILGSSTRGVKSKDLKLFSLKI